MKQLLSLKQSLPLLVITMYLCSCKAVQTFHGSTREARDADKKSFIVKTDGTIIEGNEARLRAPLFKKSTVTLDNDVKVPIKEIEAYQNDNAYYRKIAGQFAPRIKKGLINMYQTTSTYTEFEPAMGPGGMSHSHTRTAITYHVQKGDSAVIEKFTPNVVRGYVQDYAPAMEYVNVYDANKQKYRVWSYINTAATLGGLGLLMTKGLNGNKLSTAGYAGVGLFFGGVVNGFVNKIHKGRNYKNMEIAVDTYNGQVVKKKRRS